LLNSAITPKPALALPCEFITTIIIEARPRVSLGLRRFLGSSFTVIFSTRVVTGAGGREDRDCATSQRGRGS
jgi:hypothetical protein